jgi:transposase
VASRCATFQVTKLRHPRADDGVRAAVRVLLAAGDHMSTERTATINALTALLRVADLGIDARGPLRGSQITSISTWRTREEPLASTARWEATPPGQARRRPR